MPTHLPPPSTILNQLLKSLPATSLSGSPPTTSPLPTAAKPSLLTLHALFPTLLLPALDLLDRRLITRLILQNKSAENETKGEKPVGEREGVRNRERRVYYVQSQQTSSHDRSRHGGRVKGDATHYEIRPLAWSCTCAVFVSAAFNTVDSSGPDDRNIYEDTAINVEYCMNNAGEGDEDWQEASGVGWEKLGWGGLMLAAEGLPLCKHLLACVLAETWDTARGLVEDRVVEKEEMAGWAGGWGV